MTHTTLSLRKIAERISESILAEKYLKKDFIVDKIMVNLRVWHKLTNRPLDYDSIKTDKGRLQYTIEKKDIELEYWRKNVKEIVSKERMQELYEDLEKILLETGYKKQ